jgi:hypothetical protein
MNFSPCKSLSLPHPLTAQTSPRPTPPAPRAAQRRSPHPHPHPHPRRARARARASSGSLAKGVGDRDTKQEEPAGAPVEAGRDSQLGNPPQPRPSVTIPRRRCTSPMPTATITPGQAARRRSARMLGRRASDGGWMSWRPRRTSGVQSRVCDQLSHLPRGREPQLTLSPLVPHHRDAERLRPLPWYVFPYP